MIELVYPSGAKGECLSLGPKAGELMAKHHMSTSVTKGPYSYCPLPKFQAPCAWSSFPVMEPIACASITRSPFLPGNWAWRTT